MSNGTRETALPATTKPIGAEPIIEQGLVVYRPDARTMAIPDDQAKDLALGLQAQWPDDLKNNPRLAMIIAKAAIAYNLDPFLNEITVYRGKPFFPLEGRLRIAQNNDTFRGVFARPATEEERKAWGCDKKPEIVLWRADAYRSDWVDPRTGELRPVTGWGEVNILKDQNPVAKEKPNQQAEVRATKRALRTLYNTPLPFRDLPDEAEGDRDEDRVAAARYVDPATGEVLDQRPGGNLLTGGQRAVIHKLCKELGIDQERRHALLFGMFGKRSTAELTEGDAAAFIEWLGYRLAPEIHEAPDPREQAYAVVPRAASKRFHTVPEPAPMALDGPTPAADAEAVAPTDEQAAGDLQVDPVADHGPTTETVETGGPDDGRAAGALPEGTPPALAERVKALAEQARSMEPQPWWENAETVAGNKAAVRKFLKGPGVKLTDPAIAALYRLLTIALSGYDPGAGDAEQDLSPAYCAVLQARAKTELAALKDPLESLVLEGILDR